MGDGVGAGPAAQVSSTPDGWRSHPFGHGSVWTPLEMQRCRAARSLVQVHTLEVPEADALQSVGSGVGDGVGEPEPVFARACAQPAGTHDPQRDPTRPPASESTAWPLPHTFCSMISMLFACTADTSAT